MSINTLLKQKKITKYKLAQLSGVPKTTILDICSGKAKLENCAAGTLQKIARALGVSMESLLEPRPDFEIYKSHICHKVKRLGDLDFIIETLETGEINSLFERGWYIESLYLLSMVDYLCRENELPLVDNYNDLRSARLNETIYPAGVHLMCLASGSDQYKKECLKEALPEFLRHNIVEAEVRSVC